VGGIVVAVATVADARIVAVVVGDLIVVAAPGTAGHATDIREARAAIAAMAVRRVVLN
jgi:hypothetical protein